MNRDKILIEVFNDTFYRGYASKFYPHLVDEIITELIISLGTIDSDKLEQLYFSKELKYYCIAIIRNMCTNKYSPFNKMYVNNTLPLTEEVIEELINEDSLVIDEFEEIKLLKDISIFLSEHSENTEGGWYDEKLFHQYFTEDKSFRAISSSTTIPTSSVYHNVKKTQDTVINEFKNKYDDIRDK